MDTHYSRGQWLWRPWILTFFLNFAISLALYLGKAPIAFFDFWTYAFSLLISLLFWLIPAAALAYGNRLVNFVLAIAVSAFQTLLIGATYFLYGEFREFISADMVEFIMNDPAYISDYVKTYFVSLYAIPLAFIFLLHLWIWTRPVNGGKAAFFKVSARLAAIMVLVIVGTHNIRYANSRYMIAMDTSLLLGAKLAMDHRISDRKALRASFDRDKVEGAGIRDPYNIVLVINESFGKDHLPFYGNHGRSTPFLDRWIRPEKDRIIIFRNAFSNSTATDLSVPSILTGVAPYESNEKLHRAPLLWDWAKAAGYKSVLVSSQRYTWSDFDKFLFTPSLDYHHTALDMNAEVVNDLGVDDLLAAEFFKKDMDKIPTEQPFVAVYNSNALHGPYQQTSEKLGKQPDFGTRYENALFILDKTFERIYEIISERGQLDRTIFIFTADHARGVISSEQPPRLYSFYDNSVSIPLLIRFPSGWLDQNSHLRKNLEGNALKPAANTDILPTIVQILGLDENLHNREILAGLGGKSLLGHIDGDRVIIALNTNDVKRMKREGFGIFFKDRRFVFSTFEGARFFDVSNDPDETHDIWPAASPEEKESLMRIIGQQPHLQRIFSAGTS